MTCVVIEGFDIYGVDDPAADGTGIGTPGAARDRALQGVWAEMGNAASIVTPVFGARTGAACLYIGVQSGGAFQGARRVLPANYAEIFVSYALYKTALPQADDTNIILSIRDNANNALGTLRLQSNGRLDYVNEAGALIGSSAPNAIPAGTWVSVQVRILKSASVGVVNVLVNGVSVLNITGANTGATQINQLRWSINSSGSDLSGFMIDDLVVNNALGTINNSFPGDLRVARLAPASDAPISNWAQRPRALYGNGILSVPSSLSGVTTPDAVDLRFGAGQYTLEGWFRFTALPTASNRAILFSKWQESSNSRSYRLFLGSAGLNGGRLAFETSTDGAAGTVATVVSTAFSPQLGRWYHIALQRNGTQTVLFIDGVPQNAPISDTATYNANSARFCIGGQQDSGTSISANTSLEGYIDEVRVTFGLARYANSGFTPPVAAFPRGGGDANWSSVALVAGFDSALVDESAAPKTLTAEGGAARFAVTDSQAAGNKFRTVNEATPQDDTYVEAAFLAASGLLTFTGNVANLEAVNYDGVVYTFRNPFVNAANNVAIGVTPDATINNLVAAINAGPGAGTAYGTGTTASVNTSVVNRGNNQMSCLANTPGAAGNSIVTTSTAANATFLAGTLTGGQNIPGTQAFFMGRPPPLTTGVRAVAVVNRARKTDTGPGSVRADFQVADGSATSGTVRALTTTFAYYQDIVELDPSTSLALTPTSITNARLRLDRTA